MDSIRLGSICDFQELQGLGNLDSHFQLQYLFRQSPETPVGERMPSGWDVYYVVFLAAALSLSVPAALSLVSSVLRSRTGLPARRRMEPPELGGTKVAPSTELGRRLNTRFSRATNAALLLTAVGLILIPCVGEGGLSNRGLVAILSLSVFGGLGLLYAGRKGDLDWLKSFQDGDSP